MSHLLTVRRKRMILDSDLRRPLPAMIETSTPTIFLIHVVPQSSVAKEALERHIFALTKRFVLPARPHLDSEMFTHRLMRDASGTYLWEIVVDDIEGMQEDATTSESLAEAVRAEVTRCLAEMGEMLSFSAFVNLLIPGPHIDVPVSLPDDSGIISFGSDEAPWYDYARDSATEYSGKEIPARILDGIREYRDGIPTEPNLKPYGKGHVYFALEDKAHRAWLAEFFESKMAVASESDRRKIRAFAAFQTREGTTASINTYDNQIVTWGTGWGGRGWLGQVMTRAITSNTVRAALERAGVRYRSRNTYDIVDLQSKRVITGKEEALEVMRASVPLLNLLIHLARAPETREAIADAQLGTFFISAGDISNAQEMSTQALFNMVSHLKHWAPGYITGCLEWAIPQLSGQPVSPARDKQLARLAGRFFYGKARGKAWIPDWKQFQGYWRHMKEDGLDCLSDPFIQASTYPSDDPFVNAPANTPVANTTKPVAATNTTSTVRTHVLQNAVLSRVEQLELVAAGKALIRVGARGDGVSAIQQVLMTAGYALPQGATGTYDAPVAEVVKAFQRAHGLTDDGIIGAQTIKKLDASGAVGGKQ